MNFNLGEMSKKELEHLALQVKKAIKTVDAAGRRLAYEAAKKAAAEHGYSLSEITQGAGKPAGAGKAKRPPKYFNPNDTGQTWSGSGRQPLWFKEALAAGTDPSKMEL